MFHVKRFLLAVLVLAVFPAIAQTTRQAVITYQRPTAYTDGSALDSSVAVSYVVYQGAKGSAKSKVGTITALQATITTGLQPGETCWEVTAIANGVESVRSNEACKTFPFPAPNTVTITVN